MIPHLLCYRLHAHDDDTFALGALNPGYPKFRSIEVIA